MSHLTIHHFEVKKIIKIIPLDISEHKESFQVTVLHKTLLIIFIWDAAKHIFPDGLKHWYYNSSLQYIVLYLLS